MAWMGPFEPADTLLFDQEFLPYLQFLLMPGGAEVPAPLIIAAVAANQTATVAAAFNQALAAGYAQELADLLQQVRSPLCCQTAHMRSPMLLYISTEHRKKVSQQL